MSAAADTQTHRVILASAGTGKTWQLSNRYLALLLGGALHGDEDLEPERALATTFTRKAAGEIFDRLLQRLSVAAMDDAACAQLFEDVGVAPRPREQLLKLVVEVGRRLDRFQVRTLDSWFVHLAQRHGLDLGLPPNWTVMDKAESDALESAAVGRCLAAAAPEEMLELLRLLQREDPGRAAHEAVLDAVSSAHLAYVESAADAWQRLTPPPTLDAATSKRRRQELEALTAPLTKAGTPNKVWAKSLADLATAWDARDEAAVMAVGLVGKVLAGEESFGRVEIEAHVAETVGALGGHAGAVLLGRVASSGNSLRRLVERFDEALGELKRERRAYGFNDIPRLLLGAENPVATGQPAHGDVAVDHLLLDEFQDTAVQQWRVLEPLAKRITAQDDGTRSFFSVGDIKQAIYAFREGESRLLQQLDTRLAGLSPEALDVSWRSSQVVLDAVNRVFENLGGLGVWRKPVLAETAGAWSDRFHAHNRAPAAGTLPGSARLIEVSSAEDGSRARKDAMLAFTLDHVESLAHEAPGAEIGVLVRGNAPISPLIQGLRGRGLSVSGVGGNSLLDARSVRGALAALWWADHPGDTAAQLLVRSTPLGAVFGLDDATQGKAVESQAARDLRRRLVEQGYGPTLAAGEDVVAQDPAFGAWDRRRYAQLVELAFEWDRRAGLRPRDFVTHVRAATVVDEIPARIKVMTFHKSKGLEFDAVVLPDLDGEIMRSSSKLFTRRDDPFGPIDTVFPVPRQELVELWPELLELRDSTWRRDLREQLCVLYVGMTRAKCRLDMLISAAYWKGDPPQNFGVLLREAFDVGDADDNGVLWCHEDSAAQWAPDPIVAESSDPVSSGVETAWALAPAKPRPRRRTPSGEDGKVLVDGTQLLSRDSRQARELGTLVHLLMAEIEWLEDREADPSVRRERASQAARQAGLTLTDADIEAAYETCERACGSAPLVEVLGGGPQRQQLSVWRERRFDVLCPGSDGDQERLVGSFDRVVLTGPPTSPSAATVLDYKSDRLPQGADVETWLAERVEAHGPQIEAYREALAVLTGLPAAAIEGRLVFLAVGRVCTVPPAS